jgi:hypothetical protein
MAAVAAVLTPGLANSIFVPGSDVYVSGEDVNRPASYWKNGTAVVLPGKGQTYGVFVK